jgi:hypothetical protein
VEAGAKVSVPTLKKPPSKSFFFTKKKAVKNVTSSSGHAMKQADVPTKKPSKANTVMSKEPANPKPVRAIPIPFH